MKSGNDDGNGNGNVGNEEVAKGPMRKRANGEENNGDV